MRILVSGGEIIAAMRRRSSHWITNVRQGAKPVAVEPSEREAEIALAAAAALGVDFAGVDIINDDRGAPLILEVNSMAGWSGLQRVTPFSIADRVTADALAQMTRMRLRG